jgi:hypothetical protein
MWVNDMRLSGSFEVDVDGERLAAKVDRAFHDATGDLVDRRRATGGLHIFVEQLVCGWSGGWSRVFFGSSRRVSRPSAGIRPAHGVLRVLGHDRGNGLTASALPLWQELQVTMRCPSKSSALMAIIISIILRAVCLGFLSSFSKCSLHVAEVTLHAQRCGDELHGGNELLGGNSL